MDDWDRAALIRSAGPATARLTTASGKPDPAAVADYLAGNPAAVALFGDLSRQAVQKLAAGCGGPVVAAAVVARADTLRRALAGDTPNPIEVVLAGRAAVCWVAVQQYELVYFGLLADGVEGANVRMHEQRIDAAHRRLLSALRTLAVVRRLRLPDLLAVVRVEATSQ